MGSMGPRKIHAPSPCLRSPNLTPHTVYRKRHAANWGRLNGKAGPKLAASQGFRGNTGPRFLGFSIRTAAESAISRRARADRQPGCGYAQVRESLPQIAVGDGGGRVHPMDRHPSSGRFAVAKRLPHHTIVLSAVTKPLRRAVSGFSSLCRPLSVLPPRTRPEAAQVDFATRILGEPVFGRYQATTIWNRAAGGGFLIGWGSGFSRSEKGRGLCLHEQIRRCTGCPRAFSGSGFCAAFPQVCVSLGLFKMSI